MMTTLLRVALTAGSVAALAAWIKHAYRPRVKDTDDFVEAVGDTDGIDIDDDTAAEIIRRARPQLERAREFVG